MISQKSTHQLRFLIVLQCFSSLLSASNLYGADLPKFLRSLFTSARNSAATSPFACASNLEGNYAAPPWHQFPVGHRIPLREFQRLFGEKYVMRRLLEGGPIDTVKQFYAVRTDRSLLQTAIARRQMDIEQRKDELLRRFGREHAAAYSFAEASDLSVMPMVADHKRSYTLQQIAAGFANGTFVDQMVFKKNASGLGDGVVFIDPRDSQEVIITLSTANDIDPERSMTEYLRAAGFIIDSDQDLARIYVPKQKAENVIYELLSRIVSSKMMRFDSGMMESYVDATKYRNRSYETRHMAEGNILHGRIRLAKSDPNSARVRWFARIGSSGYFSNFTGRSNAVELEEPHMYDPLFEIFDIDKDKQESFKAYVEDLITREMAYLLMRYRQGGLSVLVQVRGAIDLMWLPPSEPGGFPRPFVVEADVSTNFPKSFYPKGPPDFFPVQGTFL